jgi:uncharacterized protein with PIN domain
MPTEKEKPKCPICGTELAPVYPENDPHLLYNEQNRTYQVQMRCPKCVINLMLAVKEEDLKNEEIDDFSDSKWRGSSD